MNYLNWKECGGKEWNKTDEIDLIKKLVFINIHHGDYFQTENRIVKFRFLFLCYRIYNLGVQNESEIDWSSLADGWSSARSPQWLRSKWWTIKKHVPQYLSFPGKDDIMFCKRNVEAHLHSVDGRTILMVSIVSFNSLPAIREGY